jgi:hypothetical protein
MGMNPKPTEGEQAGPFGILMMVAFWFLVWLWGPGWLTFTYLCITMGILLLITKAKGVSFCKVVGNNNWVFPAVLSMMVVSIIMANLNPMVPLPLGHEVISWVRNLFGYKELLLENSTFWGNLNYMFFGDYWTYDWRDFAVVTYAIAIIPSLLISYSDDVVRLLKEVGESQNGEEWKPFVKKYVVLELLKIPLKAVFRGLSSRKQG